MPDMKESIDNHLGIVFSTSQGRMCPTCAKPISDCSCSHDSKSPLGDGHVRVSRETKGRKGKGVTLISGLPEDTKSLQKLAKQLKRKCGAGGTLKDGVIEIQGEHRDLLVQELQALGYKAKRAGG
jgi:translation initiation factor 1